MYLEKLKCLITCNGGSTNLFGSRPAENELHVMLCRKWHVMLCYTFTPEIEQRCYDALVCCLTVCCFVGCSRSCSPSVPCWLTPTRTTLLSLRLPTCTRRTGRNTSQQPAAGHRNMRWADEYLLLIPWRFSCRLKKRSWASLFPWICCWSCVSLIHLGSYCSRCCHP